MSLFLKVALLLKQNNASVRGTETVEYYGFQVVFWALNKGHAMVLVRHDREYLDYRYYSYSVSTIKKWMLSGQLDFINELIMEKTNVNATNQDEFQDAKAQETGSKSGKVNETNGHVKHGTRYGQIRT